MAPRYPDDDEEDTTGLRAKEYPDARDMDDDDDEFIETIDCPHCGKAVYEQAERCPACGKYISGEDATPRKPRWLVVGVILCVAIVLLTILW